MAETKRIFCILSAALMLFSLAACGKKNNSSAAERLPAAAAAAGDMTDPENAEKSGETGETVTAEHMTAKKGAANGIDVSKWQGAINWSAVRAAGIDFAFIRIGFRGENGKIYKDANADYNLQQAEKAGILTGVYFFSTAVSPAEAAEEAGWTLSAIKGYSVSYPVVYDCEGYSSDNSRMKSLTAAERTDNALEFLKTVTAGGYEGMFYAAKNELEDSSCWETGRIEEGYAVMVARYTSPAYPETPSPSYSGKYSAWQYTNCGRVNGISGNTDLIVSYFTREKAEPKDKKARPADSAAPAADDGIYKAVSDEVTAKAETNLRDAAGTRSNIVASIKNGTFVKRTGIGSNGWSRLEYNGRTVYAITSYLTTDRTPAPTETASADDGFTPADGQLTAKEKTNLRDAPSTSGALVATITNGEFVKRTGTSAKGWTRLEYNGRTVYAKTSLLTTEVKAPAESSETPSANDGFSAAADEVTAKMEVNLRTAPTSGSGSQVVYTLKKGEFVRRTGINSASGWSRLEYNGQTVYAITSYLLTREEYQNSSAE